MGRAKISDWIVVDAVRQVQRCERCGAEESLKFPAAVTAFVKRMEAFGIDHERCVPADKVNP